MESAWKEVSRRKKGNQLGLAATSSSTIKPYRPFQTVTLFNKPFNPSNAINLTATKLAPSFFPKSKAMNTPSPPSSPPSNQATYYFSPHSPTQLRFPPSSQFTEWRGRCFRCCRIGHNTATCHNPMRCGKCWGKGHVGNRCTTKTLNPAALPYWTNQCNKATHQNSASSALEASLQELLKPCPMAAPSLPNNRPKVVSSFGVRDQAVVTELARLCSGVVFDTYGLELNFSIDDVAGFAK